MDCDSIPPNETRVPVTSSKLIGQAGTYTEYRFSVTSSFVSRRIKIEVPYNLRRGSAVLEGKFRDGSSLGESPVIMPWEDREVYDAKEHLREVLNNDADLKCRAMTLCDLHGITLDTLLTEGPPTVIWMDPSVPYQTYGDRQTFPLLKAIFAKQTFAIVQERKGLARVNGRFDSDYFDRLLQLEAISETVISVPEGLLVPAPQRLFGSVALVGLAVAAMVLSALYDDRTNVIEKVESAVFVLGVILLTVPALVSLFSSEPNLLKNAVRGKKILTRQSQVTKHFRLSQRDYAMLATRTRGSKLVSADVGCFLTGDERGTHYGDEPVVTCEKLASFGVICGQSVHYRTNWQTVHISNRLGENRTHLTHETPKVKYWCAGVRQNTWVGFCKG